MTESRTLLAATAAKILRGLGSENADTAWRRVAESGIPGLMVREDRGGFGGGWEDALIVLREIGAEAAALPVAETMVANRLAAEAGFGIDGGIATFAPRAGGLLARSAPGFRFSGTLSGVPWGASAGRILVCLEHEGGMQLCAVSPSVAAEVHARSNLAGEPRDDLRFDAAAVAEAAATNSSPLEFMRMGALSRTWQMAGALEAMLELTIEHAKTRRQFGRALSTFQAIQQQLAVFASETAAVQSAAAAAARAADRGEAAFEIAAAKLRANRAVDVATNIAHQVHGAIGITREHALHRYTQRLWSWKSEFGNDRFWALRLGGEAAARGAVALWPDLTDRADRTYDR